jgi:hypothetical protein
MSKASNVFILKTEYGYRVRPSYFARKLSDSNEVRLRNYAERLVRLDFQELPVESIEIEDAEPDYTKLRFEDCTDGIPLPRGAVLKVRISSAAQGRSYPYVVYVEGADVQAIGDSKPEIIIEP